MGGARGVAHSTRFLGPPEITFLKIMSRYLHYLKSRRYSFNSDFQRGLRYPGLGTLDKVDSLEKVVWKAFWPGKAS